MAKKSQFTNVSDLPETMTVKDIENAIGVSRAYAYRFVKDTGIAFQVDVGCTIKANKQAFLRAIKYVPLNLTPDLAATPIIWDVEDIAAYLKVHPQTVYEYVKRDGFPVLYLGERRMKFCREAVLQHLGYSEPLQATA